MPKLILVASPHLAFGELLRLSLEESSKFRVRLARSSSEARIQSSKAAFALLILDADLTDTPFSGLVNEIKQNQAQACLILIPPENDPQHPSLQGTSADAFIYKPFYQPDLIKTVEAVLAPPVAPAVEQATIKAGPVAPQPPDEPHLSPFYQRVLDQAVVAEPVHAALILAAGQVQANSGRLPPAAVQELAALLSRNPENHHHGDQVRFVKLSQGGELLVYATGLGGLSELAVACDATYPLSHARHKTAALARKINELAATPTKNSQAPSSVYDSGVLAAVNVNEDDLLFDESELEAPDIRVQELLASAPLPTPP